jgi:hypothetical protein
MRNTLLLLSLFAFSAPLTSSASNGEKPSAQASRKAARQALTSDSMRFVYRSYDGTTTHYCRHRLQSENSPYDWKVECSDGKSIRSEYVVHLALSVYRRDRLPNLSVELLYWITSGTRIPSEIGSTTWMHFNRDSSLASISSSQTLDRGTAGLYLEIKGSAFAGKRIR